MRPIVAVVRPRKRMDLGNEPSEKVKALPVMALKVGKRSQLSPIPARSARALIKSDSDRN
jgi:hypothetical protein